MPQIKPVQLVAASPGEDEGTPVYLAPEVRVLLGSSILMHPVTCHMSFTVMAQVKASNAVMVARCCDFKPFEHNQRQKVDD